MPSAVNALHHALLSAAAYLDVSSEQNEIGPRYGSGWQPVDRYYRRDPATGFEAAVFHRPEANEFVIAFTGTDEWQDWLESNFPLYAGKITDSFRQAVALYARVVAEHPDAKVSFTGHSLGGGLAALMGVLFEREAVSFDQAPFREAASEANRDALLPLLDGLIAEPGRTAAAAEALRGARRVWRCRQANDRIRPAGRIGA